MRIAYSCAGEGLGHAARLLVIAPELEKRHDIRFFVPETIRIFLERRRPGFEAQTIPGLAFAKRRDRIALVATLWHNLPSILLFPVTVGRLARQLRRQGYQAVISDFEPHLAWAGWLARLPVFQANHPGIVSDCMTLNPVSWIQALAAKFLEGPWTRRAHISFYQGDVGPLFRPSLFRHQRQNGTYLVLNLSKDSYRRPILHFLRQQHPGLDIRVFPDPQSDFEAALAGCGAVVSSAGHQMVAEALVLGKPILVIPQQGQWEQLLNARMLTRSGRGMSTSFNQLSRDFPLFLRQLHRFQQAFGEALPPGFHLEDGTNNLCSRIERFLAYSAGIRNFSG